MKRFASLVFAMISAGCSVDENVESNTPRCSVSLIVLGIAQDGGKPQIGVDDDAAWDDPSLRRLATSLALIDWRNEHPMRYLFEATPDIKEQLRTLNLAAPKNVSPVLDGIFLTHAHIGHYTGLMMLGHEAMGARNIVVHAMPRMAEFLTENGPWSQLVRYNNINLAILENREPETLEDGLSVTPFLVPHRQEFSEVVGYRIETTDRSVLFIPDIDSWEEWDAAGTKIEDEITKVDLAYLDATFFANGEIPGRDMSGFPHPFVVHSMERFKNFPADEKSKIRFIHMNHTNPLLDETSNERNVVKGAGFNVAREGEKQCLLERRS